MKFELFPFFFISLGSLVLKGHIQLFTENNSYISACSHGSNPYPNTIHTYNQPQSLKPNICMKGVNSKIWKSGTEGKKDRQMEGQ